MHSIIDPSNFVPSNLGGKYPFQCWEWWKCPGIFASFASHTCSVTPSDFGHNHLETKGTSVFLWAQYRRYHTCTSLVHYYLAFMAGSDAQQVAYSVILLSEIAHEWYIGYERRNRDPPGDWPQLCDALLEQFGSNIRLQEAQSTLMTIS